MGCESHNVPVLQKLFSRLGSKWSLLILIFLAQNPPHIRFTELKRQIKGISQKMLAQTLKELERDGLVARQMHAEIPPRVEYSLTELGKSLLPVARGFAEWALKNETVIEQKREEFDLRFAD
jgi:DNA-binding HxlR family transcriptional regulator